MLHPLVRCPFPHDSHYGPRHKRSHEKGSPCPGCKPRLLQVPMRTLQQEDGHIQERRGEQDAWHCHRAEKQQGHTRNEVTRVLERAAHESCNLTEARPPSEGNHRSYHPEQVAGKDVSRQYLPHARGYGLAYETMVWPALHPQTTSRHLTSDYTDGFRISSALFWTQSPCPASTWLLAVRISSGYTDSPVASYPSPAPRSTPPRRASQTACNRPVRGRLRGRKKPPFHVGSGASRATIYMAPCISRRGQRRYEARPDGTTIGRRRRQFT